MAEEETSSAAENTSQAAPAETAAPEGGTESPLFASAQSEGGATTDAESTAPEGEEAASGQTEQKDGQSEPEGAPEHYEDFKAPEGYEVDKEVTNAFKDVAKKLNLSQAAAQNVINAMAPRIIEQQIAQRDAVSNLYRNRTLTDKEVGGRNWEAAARNIARIRDTFGKNPDGSMDKDIQEFLTSPFGNHPGVIKLFARAGKAFGEAGFPRGRGSAGGKITARQVYRNTKI